MPVSGLTYPYAYIRELCAAAAACMLGCSCAGVCLQVCCVLVLGVWLSGSGAVPADHAGNMGGVQGTYEGVAMEGTPQHTTPRCMPVFCRQPVVCVAGGCFLCNAAAADAAALRQVGELLRGGVCVS